MLKIEGKTFMNIQEAVQWLLDNNALPFQCSANYQANTEIGLGTIVNPSPAKVRIGSLIFFADSKVSTVVGITETSFICSDKYNDLVDDVVYVSNVALNASGHLIVTLSNGTDIDAGLIKQVTGFSIDGSQHLIVTYNDGTTTDLGAIFNGNINIAGNLTVSGGISGNAITGNSIIEIMSGYSMELNTITNLTLEAVFGGIVKTGNKITLVIAVNMTRTGDVDSGAKKLVDITIPASVGAQLYTTQIGSSSVLSAEPLKCYNQVYNPAVNVPAGLYKQNNTLIRYNFFDVSNLTLNTKYYARIEITLLLSENLLA